MPITPNFTSIYSKKWEISFIQCYPNGQLKYTELCNLLQLTAGFHAEMGGLSFSDMQVFHQAWVLSRMRVEVKELPKWRDIVTVKTWIVEMQGSKSIRALEWYVSDKKMGGSLTFWVVLNTTLRKPEKLALPFEHFQLFPNQLATEKSFDKITLDSITNLLKYKTVELSDLDIVNHANNVKYLEWCLDCINPTVLLKNGIKAFDMNFLRELHWHDEVAIKATLEEKPKQFTVVKNQKICFALELEYKSI
jgi:medium-chain acyl-[acyl-carrier-protein] hydrolase